jgi:hypothetical protein
MSPVVISVKCLLDSSRLQNKDGMNHHRADPSQLLQNLAVDAVSKSHLMIIDRYQDKVI